jgi:hypothetical protein
VKKIMFVLAAALLLASCSEEEIPPVPPPQKPVEGILKTVEIAFSQHSIRYLETVLAPDFVFHFDPDDVGQNPPGSQYVIPELWSRAEFKSAAVNMFTHAYSISLTINTAGVGEPGPNETTYKADNVNIELLVMVDKLSGFIAEQGYCDFAFKCYEREAGNKVWRLTKWWDNTAVYYDAKPGISPTSLGRVLALYY